ncbi:MAG: metallophosphoesterase [Victivallales bacterium]|nr:metallophosphoesterase [Victivallales bacterium]
MKRGIFAIFVAFVCGAGLFAADAAKAPAVEVKPIPEVTVSEPYVKPALSNPDNWMMAVIPDTQTYSKFTRNHGIIDMMFTWIVENSESLNIQQAVFLGDLMDCNRRMMVFDWLKYLSATEQWSAISKLCERFDNKLPYVLATGNHDYGYVAAEDHYTEFPRYFHPERNSKWRNCLVDMAPNNEGHYTLENAAYEFTTPSGQLVLIVSLAFAPTDTQLAWAKGIFARKKYKDAFGIVVNHAYLRSMIDTRDQGPNSRVSVKSYVMEKQGGNIGEDIWNKVVRVSPNVKLVLCGHMCFPEDWRAGLGRQVSINDAGGKVHEVLFDTQALGGGWDGNGGDGWIRLLEFSKDLKTIKVRTFSPYFAGSPALRKYAWHTHPANEFILEY